MCIFRWSRLKQRHAHFGGASQHPWAVNLTLEVAGSVTPFYADNLVYYQATANQGYTGTMEFALYDEWFRMNVLKEIKDENGVLVENAAVQPAPVAMLYQVEGDEKQAKRVLYYVQVGRPGEINATVGETTEPQTATASITVMPLPNTQDVKAHTTDDTDPEVYANWFSEVHVRSGEFTPDATLKALSLGTVSLDPVFSSATKQYTAATASTVGHHQRGRRAGIFHDCDYQQWEAGCQRKPDCLGFRGKYRSNQSDQRKRK